MYQGPGGPDEDRRGGFDRGGWTTPHFDEETGRFVTAVFERADALLLGRRTWQIFDSYWPHHDAGDPVSHGINVLPKYVASTTLTDPTWQNTHVIDGDVEAWSALGGGCSRSRVRRTTSNWSNRERRRPA